MKLTSVNLKEAADLLSQIETSVDEKIRTDMDTSALCLCKQILECAIVQKKLLEEKNSAVVQEIDIVIEFMKKKINSCFKLKKGHLRPVEIAAYLQTTTTTTTETCDQDQDLDRTIEVIHKSQGVEGF